MRLEFCQASRSRSVRDSGADRELKREAGRAISVLGSGELVQTLIRHGLMDEVSLTIDPNRAGQWQAH